MYDVDVQYGNEIKANTAVNTIGEIEKKMFMSTKMREKNVFKKYIETIHICLVNIFPHQTPNQCQMLGN